MMKQQNNIDMEVLRMLDKFPDIESKFQIIKKLENEIKGKILEEVFNLNHDTILNLTELAEFEEQHRTTLFYNFDKKYELKNNSSKVKLVYLRSSQKVNKYFNKLKEQVN